MGDGVGPTAALQLLGRQGVKNNNAMPLLGEGNGGEGAGRPCSHDMNDGWSRGHSASVDDPARNRGFNPGPADRG